MPGEVVMTRHTGRESPFRSEVLETMSVVEGGPKRAELENFLGGLLNKAKALVKGAVRLATKGIAVVRRGIPWARLLDKLKGLIKPLLRRVLKFAIGRLPTPVATR